MSATFEQVFVHPSQFPDLVYQDYLASFSGKQINLEEGRRKKKEGRRKKEEKMDGDSNPNQLSTPCRRWGIKAKIKR